MGTQPARPAAGAPPAGGAAPTRVGAPPGDEYPIEANSPLVNREGHGKRMCNEELLQKDEDKRADNGTLHTVSWQAICGLRNLYSDQS
jgi:hypothetical protein